MEMRRCEPGEEGTGDFLSDSKPTNYVRGKEMTGCLEMSVTAAMETPV